MTFFLLLSAIAISFSLCSGAPQLPFQPQAPVDGPVLINRPLMADLFSVEDFDPISLEVFDVDSSEEVQVPLTLEQIRTKLMRDLGELERDIEEDIFENDFLDVQSSLFKLNNKVWPKLVAVSDKIYYQILLANDTEALEREHWIRTGLKRDVSRMRFKTGTRKCPSSDESYFAPTKRCVIVESTEVELNPCASKKDMLLYDGMDNRAVCDCMDDERQLVFTEVDGLCHPLNQQGPCQNGSWLFMSAEGKIVCEQVPVDCPADGQHVYWSQDPLVAKPQCFQLGVRGPCAEGQVLGRNFPGALDCVLPPRPKPLVQLRTKCPLGSFRGQNQQCPV
ncbi:uncharacterized protein LOC124197076 [Daphnia pulex]|uniref:uncharacterized protein LOC124197076 n=1 Tax=Daphnia pulex TaxID=6669 RepID=UPI001EDCEA96|nr:uncharacterized protein LOC124197076 [Daphnia pulex]